MYLTLNRLYFGLYGFYGLIRREILINFEQPIRGRKIELSWLVGPLIVRETQMRPFCGPVEIAPHPSPLAVGP